MGRLMSARLQRRHRILTSITVTTFIINMLIQSTLISRHYYYIQTDNDLEKFPDANADSISSLPLLRSARSCFCA